MMELQRDENALQWPQHAERHEQHQRNPQHGMHPVRRTPDEFDNDGKAHHEKSSDQDHEHRRPVAGIGEAIVEAADIAALREIEKPGKQLAPPATRAAATHSREIGR